MPWARTVSSEAQNTSIEWDIIPNFCSFYINSVKTFKQTFNFVCFEINDYLAVFFFSINFKVFHVGNIGLNQVVISPQPHANIFPSSIPMWYNISKVGTKSPLFPLGTVFSLQHFIIIISPICISYFDVPLGVLEMSKSSLYRYQTDHIDIPFSFKFE